MVLTAGGGGIQSFFARAQYDYKEKYLLAATMRVDGSSNFAPENRWGYFPSLSGLGNYKRRFYVKVQVFLILPN
jgi:hypothetical protein